MDWTLSVGSLSFGIFDLIVLGAIVIGGVSGAAIGFTRSATKIMGYVLCFPLALLFVNPLSNFILSKSGLPIFVCSLLSYVALCAFIFVLFRIFGNLLGQTFEALGLGVLDSIVGFFWGAILLVGAIFILFELCSFQTFFDLSPLKENSIIYQQIFLKLFPPFGKALKGALLESR